MQASLLVVMCDATANNTALEVLDCDTVIFTMVGGIPNYVDNTFVAGLWKADGGPNRQSR